MKMGETPIFWTKGFPDEEHPPYPAELPYCSLPKYHQLLQKTQQRPQQQLWSWSWAEGSRVAGGVVTQVSFLPP